MARPTNSGEPDMATEDFNLMTFPPSSPFLPTLSSLPLPSAPLYFPTSSNLMVAHQWSDQSSMDNPLRNQQQQPLTPLAPPISRTNPYAGISQSVSIAAPTNSEESEMATEEYLIYWNSPSPSSNSMVVYYQGSDQLSLDNPLQNQQRRPANSGDQSDMATEEHFDVMSLLNLPQLWPSPSPCSSANSMLVYQQASSQSSMDFVDRPLYIAGDMALLRQGLLQFWMDASDELGTRRRGIMSMKKENLPQSLECLGISLLHLYVEDKFDTLLYWQGESSWEQLCGYLGFVYRRGELRWSYAGDDLERNDHGGRCMFGNERVTMGVWRIGPREWVAKIRYRRHSLESLFERGRDCDSESRVAVLKEARLNFPDIYQDFLHALHALAVEAAQRKDPDEDDIDFFFRTIPVINSRRLTYWIIFPRWFWPTAYPDEDFVNGEVEPVRIGGEGTEEAKIAESPLNPDEDFVNGEVEPIRIGGEGTEEAEIAEPQLNPGPSRKKQRKEKIPTHERGNKKTTRVKNVFTLEKILQVKEMSLKGAAELLKVSQSALKRACREHGINRWPPRNKHECIGQALPNETPAVDDQEGIPQLTSNTLCSDQVLTATANTDSVTEETAQRHFLSTVRQDNPNEDHGNDDVEAVGIGGAGTREGEMKQNEKAPGVVRGKYKTTGVRIEIALEEILRYREMHLKDAARELKVGRSTLKRICRDYNIHKWPPREEHVLTGQSHPNESPTVVDQERIPQLNFDMLLRSNQITASNDTNSVTVKAKYKGLRIKFQLFSPWRKVELEQEVKKRLQLDAATYYINYKDEDDEMTLIGCDEDLEGYISSTSHLGTSSIELFLEPK